MMEADYGFVPLQELIQFVQTNSHKCHFCPEKYQDDDDFLDVYELLYFLQPFKDKKIIKPVPGISICRWCNDPVITEDGLCPWHSRVQDDKE